MKVTLVASEFPFPPRHGGQVDMWRRICALSDRGIELQLVAWHAESAVAEDLKREAARYVASLVLLKKRSGMLGGAARLLLTTRYPSQVAARFVSKRHRASIASEVARFQPEVIVVDGLFAWQLGYGLASDLGVPPVLRSHNIEHRYIPALRRKARGVREKIGFLLAGMHLARFETDAITRCARFYDISLDDLSYWRSCGNRHGEWLPPFCGPWFDTKSDRIRFEIGFLGNLYAPNNVDGLIWLVSKVLPRLGTGRRLLIAGSNPSTKLRKAIDEQPCVELWENPERSADVYSRCSVLVNPVMAGSGVNLKSLEMLQTDRPIVSTPQGLAGLPDDVRALFLAADSPERFATAIERALVTGAADASARHVVVNKWFGDAAVTTFVDSLTALAAEGRRQ